MYLAHQLLTTDYNKMPHCCFADHVILLRKEAVNVLSKQISRQEKILLSIIKESGESKIILVIPVCHC